MLLVAAALAVQAPGPSFSCERATAPQEKLLCSRRTLAKADVELDAAYRKALARLSPAGRRQLRLSQRAWLRFRQTVCPLGRRSQPWYRSTEDCLEARYGERLSELEQAVRDIGPYRVVRLDGYRVWPAPGQSGWYDGFLAKEERFDWIDVDAAPASLRSAARAWNAGLGRRAATAGERWYLYGRARREGEEDMDSGRDLEILAASAEVIVSRQEDYWAGVTHPWEEIAYGTRLTREGRAMRFDDLLTRPAAWALFAERRVMAVLPMNKSTKWRGLGDRAKEATSLVPGPAGLTVNFGQLLGRPSGEVRLELSWKEVEPFLSPSGRRIAAGFVRQGR